MLFVFDIDGTLVSHGNGHSYIPESTIKAINLIKESGHKILLATGRNYSQSIDIMRKFNLSDGVFCDGSVLYIDHALVFSKSLSVHAIESFVLSAEKHKLTIVAQDPMFNYISCNPQCVNENNIINVYMQGLTNKDYIIEDIPTNKEFNNFSCFSNFEFEVFEDVDYTNWPLGTSMQPKGISKAFGIIEYIKRLEIDRKDVHVFGDNINDIDMFNEFYENSNVLGGAKHSVRIMAKHQLDEIDNDGLSNRILEILKGD